MLRKIMNAIISKLRSQPFEIDSACNSKDLICILCSYFVRALRGEFFKCGCKTSKGLIFAGANSHILHANHCSLGKSLNIGNNVVINALSSEGVVIGDNVTIKDNTIIECTAVLRSIAEGIRIGDNVGISQNCFFAARAMIEIGNDVIIGPGVSFFSENHNYKDVDTPIRLQGETRRKIVIEDDVWIGANATILAGVRVGKHSVIGAGSVVTKDVSANSVVAGCPAKAVVR